MAVTRETNMKNTKEHYGWISILLHWLAAITVFGLFGLGYWMVDLDYYDSLYKTAPALHKSVGLSLLAIMIFRLIWRLIQVQPGHLESHKPIERKIGAFVHLFLYFLLFVIMFAGYFISTADGRGIDVFGLFEVPGFGSLIENQEDKAGVFHQYAAYLLMLVVFLHAAAALKHHFIDKDKTLTRMIGKRN